MKQPHTNLDGATLPRRFLRWTRSWAPVWSVLILCLASTYLYWESLFRRYESARDQKIYANLAGVLARDLSREVRSRPELTQYLFDHVARRIAELAPSTDLFLLDPAGGIVLAFSEHSGRIEGHEVNMAPIRKLLQDPALSKGAILGDSPYDREVPAIFSVAPVSLPGFDGFTYVVLHNRYHRLASIPHSEPAHVFGTGLFLLEAGAFIAVFSWILHLVFRRMFIRISGVLENAASDLPAETLQAAISGGGYEEAIVESIRRLADDRSSLLSRESEIKLAISKISHDARSPLMMIQHQAEKAIAGEQGEDDGVRRQQMESVIRNVRSLASLISDLDMYELLSRSQLPYHPAAFDLGELIDSLHSIYAFHAEREQVELTVEYSHDLPAAWGDHRLIERVLRNLLENAIRHCNPGGRVRIEVALPDPEHISIAVADSGVGIPAAELPLIFEPFHQVEGSNREKGKSGLGLSIAQQIVRHHGSTLTVTSEEGKGARFSFELRRAGTPGREASE